MTHLVRLLGRTSSSQRWTIGNERYSISRIIMTSQNVPEFLSETQSEGKESVEQTKCIKKRMKKDFRPVILKPNVLQKVRSVAGISVSSFSIGWAKFDLEEMRLQAFMSADIVHEDNNYVEVFAYKRAKSIMKILPESDLYIMERCSYYKKSKEDKNFSLMITSMLAVLLSNSTGPLGEENVLFQNPNVIDHLFKLKMDKERISGGQVLRRMLDNSVNEQLASGESDITISVQGTTFTARRGIVKSMLFSKPTINHSNAIALFIALSFIVCNPK